MLGSHKLVYGVYIIVWIIMAINPKYPDDCTQGDIWDAQKDTLLALFGALVNVVFFQRHYKSLLNEHTSKDLKIT